jgi:hypothetical protein
MRGVVVGVAAMHFMQGDYNCVRQLLPWFRLLILLRTGGRLPKCGALIEHLTMGERA